MKVVILAGGYGTRLSEETIIKPKPMVEIGGFPLLWHIMKIYSYYGFDEFIILLGYKGYMIKEYFANYVLHNSSISINLSSKDIKYHSLVNEPWKITLLDTGLDSMTGGRLLRAKDHLNGEPFLLTYGDGLCDVNIKDLLDFHKKNKKLATLTAVQPQGRFGSLKIDKSDKVLNFNEKPDGDGSWINGGFFVCENSVIDYIENDSTVFEHEPLTKLANEKNLIAFKHKGFWQCMDTLRDKEYLLNQWNSGKAKWKIW